MPKQTASFAFETERELDEHEVAELRAAVQRFAEQLRVRLGGEPADALPEHEATWEQGP